MENQVFCPSSNANILYENDNKALLTKSNSRRFASIKKMFDPLTKSSSRRNSLSSNLEISDIISSNQIVSGKSNTQLHGVLRLEHKHGVPYFELSLPHSEQIFVAKTWKSEDKHNWVYTFHSAKGKKKSNGNKISPIVAQMQVSSHLCGSFSDSMVTEFVLYDTMQTRKSFPIEEFSSVSDSEYSSPYPWAPGDLNPSLEIGAIVFRAPLKKRESLKCSSGDLVPEKRVDVVIPMGNHSLPNCESEDLLSLLDKWRFGGGCDCGGWDMACPLVVFSNHSEIKEELPFLHKDGSFELCVQGSKEKVTALTINLSGKGKYAVNFLPQFSTLQAFGICIAMLHSTDASTSVEREKKAQFNTLKDLFEDEMKTLIESVTEKRVKENHPSSFMLNPPFSPISRV